MPEGILPALLNGIAVAGGLFVLWSLIGRMRELPAGTRASAAIFAGVVAVIVTLVVTTTIRALASGAPGA
jgi:hypothetical protein